jgi:hypothetical protein
LIDFGIDLRLRQREHDLRRLLITLQLSRAEVSLVTLGEAKGEYFSAKEDQRAMAALPIKELAPTP